MGSGRWLSEGWDWQAEAWLEDVEAEKGRLVGENTKLREEVASLAAQVEEANSQAQSAAGDGIGMVEGLRARVACVEAEKESIEKELAEVRVALCKEKEELVTDLEQSERQREIAEQKFDKCKALLQVRGLCFCLWGCVIL